MLVRYLSSSQQTYAHSFSSSSVLGRCSVLTPRRFRWFQQPRSQQLNSLLLRAVRSHAVADSEHDQGQADTASADWKVVVSGSGSGTTRMERGAAQPRLAHVALEDGCLAANGGFNILEGVGDHIRAKTADGMSGAVVLSVAAGNATSRFDVTIGSLQCTRLLACSRIKLWWMVPEWGTGAADIPPETQFLLVELGRGGPFAVILPLIDSGRFKCTLRPPRKGTDSPSALGLRIESGDDAVAAAAWESAVLVAAGYDPFLLVDLAVAASAKLSGGSRARADKVVPDFVNYFGWCTWDAFYSTVSAEGIQQGLRSLKDGGVAPRFLIIDDGWQQSASDPIEAGGTTERLEAKKELLKAVGAGGHYPVNKLQGEGQNRSWYAGLLERSIGRAEGVTEILILGLYKALVEGAPQGSRQISVFDSLSKGRMRSMLLNYYALTSDHTQRLQGVKANGKFSGVHATAETPMSQPEDLKSIVTDARERFGVKYVYAWHSLHGYWAGIRPGNSTEMPYDGQLIMPHPTPGVLEVDPCFAWAQQILSGVGVAKDVKALYSDMHTYLKGAGIDGVKVDCQAILGMVGGGSPGLGGGPALSAEYHAALETSVGRHFPGNNCINCMCHSTEDMYRMEATTVARSSDDFWPREPASHTTHVAVNAFNSLFMGAILQPDWDMFHSEHPAAQLHATARVVSGGPLYVSDAPGRHDFALLRRLVLPSGRLLRCRQPGRPTIDCLFSDVMRDGASALKVWNVNACSGIVAAFNLQGAAWSRRLRKYATHDADPPSVSAVVSPADLPPYKDGEHMKPGDQAQDFAVYSDARRKLWLLRPWEGVHCRLPPAGSDLFTIAPVLSATDGSSGFAPIGLANMLNCGGAVLECSAAGKAGAPSFRLKVEGAGQLLAYSSKRPASVIADGHSIDFTYSADDSALNFELTADRSSVEVQL